MERTHNTPATVRELSWNRIEQPCLNSLSLALLGLLLIFTTVACGPPQLAREKAGELLQSAIKSLPPSANEFHFGQRWSDLSKGEWQGSLVNKGMITDVDLGRRSVSAFQSTHFYEAQLTSEGAKYKLGERTMSDRYSGATFTLCNMRMADQEFVAITGIRQNSADSAQVDFTWRYANITPFGEVAPLLTTGGDKLDYSPMVRPATVTISRYDDGWRLPSGWTLPVQKAGYE